MNMSMKTTEITTEQVRKMVETFEKTPFIQQKLADAKAKAINIVEKLQKFVPTQV
jgi:hypothetical protein